MVSRGSKGRSPLGRRFAPYVRVAARGAYKAYRSYTQSKKKYASSTPGITTQRDVIRQYRRRRMPYRRKKGWIAFSRKVRAVMQKDMGTKTAVFNGSVGPTSGFLGDNATQQGYAEVALYGFKGVADGLGTQGFQDMQKLYSGSTTPENIRFKSAVLDITARSLNRNVELDVYDITCRKTINHNALSAVLIDGFSAMPNLPGAATGITLTQRGVTIFDCPDGIKLGGIKVHKKMKYFLPTGSTMTYQIRDPRNRYFNGDDITQTEAVGFNKPGMTRILFFIWKALPGEPNAGSGDWAQMQIGTTRKYSWTVLEENASADRFG